MPKPPRRPPSTRKTDPPSDAVAGRPLVARPTDPRQAALFDEPLPKWMRPCLPTLVDKPPVGPQWVHEIKWDGYRVSAYVAGGTGLRVSGAVWVSPDLRAKIAYRRTTTIGELRHASFKGLVE